MTGGRGQTKCYRESALCKDGQGQAPESRYWGKQCLHNGEVDTMRWRPGVTQLANFLTKRGAPGHHLRQIFYKGRIELDV